jgi:aldoxime dehydratase
LRDTVGVYREIITAPTDRIETIYWPDFPGGAMRDESVMIYPTPYCGYYGAMRDRLPVSAHDDLSATATATAQLRESLGARWHVRVPANVAVIRSSHTWSAMDDQQLADYTAKLAPPLERGMAYLETRQEGSLSLRNHITTTEHGEQVPEMHATGMFIDLGHMEGWAEGHKSHAAIFSAAVARYKHYGQRNQLRTWHEVYILPEGNTFEYVNCHGDTGLLPYFEAEKL